MKSGKTKKKSILSEWRARKRNAGPDPESASKTRETSPSSDQKRLWFLQSIHADNPFYHYAELYRVSGELDVERFTKSYRKVALRHDALRALFIEKNGVLIVDLSPEPIFETNHFEVKGETREEQTSELRALAVKEARKPFDLSNGPLSRISIFKLGSESAVLITMHHIITDKWSMQILRDEIAAYYRGADSDLTPLEMQFGDYAAAEGISDNPVQLEYWRGKLEGALSMLELPIDKARPDVPTFKGSFVQKPFPEDLSERILGYCRKIGVTPYVFMLAAFQALLARYSGSDDLLVGSPITGRDRAETERLIGFFDHTSVLRGRPEPHKSFADLLEETRITVTEALTNRQVRFSSLVKILNPERSLSHNPLFQVMFIYHQKPAASDFGPGIDLSYQPFDFGVAKFDLTLFISEEDNRLTPIFEYAQDLFHESTIRRMHAHFRNLIESLLNKPDAKLSDHDILDQAEAKKIVVEWNRTAESSDQRPVHERIIEQASMKPDVVAISLGDSAITYRELVLGSSSVAAFLESAVLPEKRTAVLFEPSFDMFTSILGVLRAGHAYVPIEPDLPVRRIAGMIESSSAGVLLTNRKYKDLLKTELNIPVIAVENLPQHDFRDRPVDKDSGAYIIHTSGSTGTPKAVSISHRNLTCSNGARLSYYENTPDSFLLLSDYSFDSSVAGIFWTLCSGGELVLTAKRAEQDLASLTDTIAGRRVTHTLLLPTLYETILRLSETEKLKTLKTVILAGESIPSGLCAEHFGKLENTDLFNEYGPTEATVWSTVHKITKDDSGKSIPIGRPIPNYKIYILDETLIPVPVGVAGEMFIGGPGVARYIGNEGSDQATRFIASPFDPEDRLYRTGDLCRFLPDGTILFLGRKDSQVKIRGYRIEPGEIDFELRNLPGVIDSVTIAREDAVSIKTPEGLAGEIAILLESVVPAISERIIESVDSLSEDEAAAQLAELEVN